MRSGDVPPANLSNCAMGFFRWQLLYDIPFSPPKCRFVCMGFAVRSTSGENPRAHRIRTYNLLINSKFKDK